MSFNLADIVILLCFVPAIFGGLIKGFVRQAAGLAALLLGIWAGYHFSELVSAKLCTWIDTSPQWLSIISFAAIFIVVLLLVTLVGRLSEKAIQLVLLGWLDKLLGLVFAIVKTAFILSIIIYILVSLDSLIPFLPHETLEHSRIYSFIASIAPKFFPYIKNIIS